MDCEKIMTREELHNLTLALILAPNQFSWSDCSWVFPSRSRTCERMQAPSMPLRVRSLKESPSEGCCLLIAQGLGAVDMC